MNRKVIIALGIGTLVLVSVVVAVAMNNGGGGGGSEPAPEPEFDPFVYVAHYTVHALEHSTYYEVTIGWSYLEEKEYTVLLYRHDGDDTDTLLGTFVINGSREGMESFYLGWNLEPAPTIDNSFVVVDY